MSIVIHTEKSNFLKKLHGLRIPDEYSIISEPSTIESDDFNYDWDLDVDFYIGSTNKIKQLYNLFVEKYNDEDVFSLDQEDIVVVGIYKLPENKSCMITFSTAVGLALIGSDFYDILDLSDIKEISKCHFGWCDEKYEKDEDEEYKDLLNIKEYIKD